GSPGVFVLGYTRDDEFVVAHLSRSDTDIRAELKKHLHGVFHQFKFAYAISAADAFRRHCEIYHESVVTLENGAHPRPPQGADVRCARCKLANPGDGRLAAG